MDKSDFNRIKEIAEELNNIRLKNNLKELQLIAKDQSFTYFEYHEEWNEVTLITRGGDIYKDFKAVYMKQNKENNIIENMEYNEYINYNSKLNVKS